MDVATLLTLAQTLLLLLDSFSVIEISHVWSFRTRLSKLKDTMSTIIAVLLDAEEQDRQEVHRSHVERDCLEKLKDAVYDVDDIFDEVATVAQRKNVMSGSEVSKEVRVFFSRFNQLVYGFKMFRDVEKIRGRLDCIAKDHHDFGLRPLGSVGAGRTLLRKREESHSFVRLEDVIGRDGDKDEVVRMLLDADSSCVEKDVRFVTVVGIGGLGKTTLAQLVYNDERIKREFPLRLWVCVSDDFEIKSLLCKILMSATNQRHDDLEMDQLCSLVREKINGEKYLLVLDDVWCENRDQWLKFREILSGGEKDSRVLVSTRSKEVARLNGSIYELDGLSEEDSWHLFEKMSFENEELRTNANLIEIGKHIVSKCANVPLAIRVVGSLLYGQSKSMWSSFRNTDLVNIKQDDKNNMMAILKLSYHRLAPPLKCCFSYCALFPKDYKIKKEILISLWMAQGFIVPLEGQSVEDAGEEYFRYLLHRCFFQNVDYDVYGDEIVSCEMHDLMHDLAQVVAGADISTIPSYEKTRHFAMNDDVEAGWPGGEKLRTFFRLHSHPSLENIPFAKMKRLRVLDLHATCFKSLHSSVDKMLHLRYLDLSDNKGIEVLPSTFSNLVNLQTLKLQGCERLQELPRDIRKLVNLRHLDIYGCDSLTHMPPGMSHLTRLHKLTMFVIGESTRGSKLNRDRVGKLEDLESLVNLRGRLAVKIRQDSVIGVPTVENAQYLRCLEHLKDIDIVFEYWGVITSDQIDNYGNEGAGELLLSLKPNPNIRVFRMERYPGVKFPNWAVTDNLAATLPNLVELCLGGCRRLKYLPLLDRLSHLRALKLYRLDDLEYVQISTESSDDQLVLFPSLETLRLWGLPKLKGCWSPLDKPLRSAQLELGPSPVPSSNLNLHSDLGPIRAQAQICSISPLSSAPPVLDTHDGRGQKLSLCPPHSFPGLSDLKIRACPNLTSIPLCTNLEKLILRSCFKDVISSLFVSCYQYHPSEMTIEFSGSEAENLPIHQEDQTRLFSTLNSLKLSSWPKLNNLSEVQLDQLTALRELHLCNLDSLEKMEDCNFNHNLRKMQFSGLPKLMNLPQGIKYCAALETLEIYECQSLKALPEWISCLTSLECLKIHDCNGLKSLPRTIQALTSLRQLEIENCQGLTERCRAPNGEDWHIIEHIPYVFVREINYGT